LPRPPKFRLLPSRTARSRMQALFSGKKGVGPVEMPPRRRLSCQERMVRLRDKRMVAIMAVLTTFALMLAAAPAVAEPFVLLVYETPDQIALRDDKRAAGAACWGAFADFGKAATEAGIRRGGAAMLPAPVAVAGTAERPGGLVLGGFFQIDVADSATAARWAGKNPAAATGAADVRAARAIGRMGRFQCKAASQAVRCERGATGNLNLPALRTLHAALERLCPTLGGAVAAAAVEMDLSGLQTALDRPDALHGAGFFQPAQTLRAECPCRPGRTAGHAHALQQAIWLTEDSALRDRLLRRMPAA